jgi:hypothetical protein
VAEWAAMVEIPAAERAAMVENPVVEWAAPAGGMGEVRVVVTCNCSE